MRTVLFESVEALAPHRESWQRLATGQPFRSWEWSLCWWRHYGEVYVSRKLHVLGVLDDAGRLAGLLPWYLEVSPWHGRVLRFLGGGEACSEYLGVMADPGREAEVIASLADWLTRPVSGPRPWDLLEMTSVDGGDAATIALADALGARECQVHRRPGPNCWRIALPETWDAYLATLSKQHRNQLRKTERRLVGSGRASIHHVGRLEELPDAQQALIDLHQARRAALGDKGCFASPVFTAFHREVMAEMLRAGALRLEVIRLDGKPLAIEYLLAGGDTIYAYQTGLDATRLRESPGRLGNLLAIRGAIAHGYRGYDFLRGDEPYKAHWRAAARACVEIRVVPSTFANRLRHRLWLAGAGAREWVRRLRHGGRDAAANAPANAAADEPAATAT